MEETCKHPGCVMPKGKARGYCNAHLLRIYRGQNMDNPVRVSNLTDHQRFWAKVDKTSSCWIWTGAKKLGYGVFRLNNEAHLAHRVSYEWARGLITNGFEVDHTCFNKDCVNPGHLRLLSHSHNGQNRAGANRNSKSGVRGVYWVAERNLWLARVVIDRTTHEVGAFPTIEEAAEAVAAWRRIHMPHSVRDQEAV